MLFLFIILSKKNRSRWNTCFYCLLFLKKNQEVFLILFAQNAKLSPKTTMTLKIATIKKGIFLINASMSATAVPAIAVMTLPVAKKIAGKTIADRIALGT